MVLAAALLCLFLFWRSAASRSPENLYAPNVAVAKARRADLASDLTLSAEFHPFQEISLHAKVSGFLKSIAVDVGDSVKPGQKIAELEIPELEEDLAKTESGVQASKQEIKRAEADALQAQQVYQRLIEVSKEHPKLIAQQEIDNAKAKADAGQGSLGAAKQRTEEALSEVRRNKTLLAYSEIVAPFGGIITQRFADPGALIQSGTNSNTQAMPLVELAEQDVLRLVFPVPESAVARIRIDAPVDITVSALNESFQGKISRFSGKLDRSTRTMHTEVDVPNPDLKYKPGMYAYVRLILEQKKDALAIPVQALMSGESPSVYVLTGEGTIERRSVKLGLQPPGDVEITEGLKEGDLVVVGNRSGLRTGQKAVGKIVAPPKQN